MAGKSSGKITDWKLNLLFSYLKGVETMKHNKTHFGIIGQYCHCEPAKYRKQNIIISSDWSKVTCLKCLSLYDKED